MLREHSNANRFSDKKVVVTGGSRGIRRSIALAFAAEGAHVAICARSVVGLEAAEVELKRHGGMVSACPVSSWQFFPEEVGVGPVNPSEGESEHGAEPGADVATRRGSADFCHGW